MALLESILPTIVGYFAKGQLHEDAIKRYCVSVPTKLCRGKECQGFKFKYRKHNWRYYLLTRRRGRCAYLGS